MVCLVVIPIASEAPKEAMMIPPIINSVIGSIGKNCIEPNANRRREYTPVATRTSCPFALKFAMNNTRKLPATPPIEFAAVKGPIQTDPCLNSLSTINGIISL